MQVGSTFRSHDGQNPLDAPITRFPGVEVGSLGDAWTPGKGFGWSVDAPIQPTPSMGLTHRDLRQADTRPIAAMALLFSRDTWLEPFWRSQNAVLPSPSGFVFPRHPHLAPARMNKTDCPHTDGPKHIVNYTLANAPVKFITPEPKNLIRLCFIVIYVPNSFQP